MPITDIDKFLAFYDQFSQEEINKMLDEFASDEDDEYVVYPINTFTSGQSEARSETED